MSVPHSDRDGSEAPKSHEGSEPETAFGPSGSPSNPTGSSDVLRRVTKYRAAIMAASLKADITGGDDLGLAAKAVIEVADKEQEALRAEVERVWDAATLRTRAAAAEAERDRYKGDAKHLFDKAEEMRKRAEKAEAIVERVRALAEGAIDCQDCAVASDVLAILDADAPEASEEGRS